MGFNRFLAACKTIVQTSCDPRDERAVPPLESVALDAGAVNIDAAVMYADLANSTELLALTNPNSRLTLRVFLLYRCSLR